MLSILPAFSSSDLKVFLRLKKSFKSSAGGQRRDCVIYSVPLSLLSINPTDSPRHASRLWRSLFLVKVCARAGKTLISRPNLCASGSCRALRACLLAIPEDLCHVLRTRHKSSSTAEVKIADGRFRVGDNLTVVPRPEGVLLGTYAMCGIFRLSSPDVLLVL